MKKMLLLASLILALNTYGAENRGGVLFFAQGIWGNRMERNINQLKLEDEKKVIPKIKKKIKAIKYIPPIIWVEGIGVKGKEYINTKPITSATTHEGILVINNGKVINKDVVNCEGINTVGIRGRGTAQVINKGIINTNKKWQRGMDSQGNSKIFNDNIINVNGPTSYGMYGYDNATITNNNIINVNNNYSMGMSSGGNSTMINNGKIILNKAMNIGIEVWNKNPENVNNKSGEIDARNGVGVLLLKNGSLHNKGLIKSNGKQAIGVRLGSDNSYFINEGKIEVDGGAGIMGSYKSTAKNGKTGIMDINRETGFLLSDLATGENDGIINVNSGEGVYSYNDGNFINNGTMNIKDKSIGIYLQGDTLAENYGTININSGVGVLINNRSVFTNEKTGVINVKKGSLTDNIADDGKFVNSGKIIDEDVLKIPKLGKFYMEATGKIKAKEVDGNIYLGNSFKEKYGNKYISPNEIIEGKFKGQILTGTPLYKSVVKKTNKGYKVEVTRNKFTEVIKNKESGKYLENNFKVVHGKMKEKRDFIFDTLSGIPGEKVLNGDVENFLGNKFYGSLDRETRDMVDFNRNTLFNNVFSKNTDEEVRWIGGINYMNRKIRKSETLFGYREKIGGIYLGGDRKISKNLRGGIISTIGASDFDYSNNSNRRDNIYEGDLYGIYKLGKNTHYILDGFLGTTHGKIRRNMKIGVLNKEFNSKFNSIYYGFNNKLVSKIQLKDCYIIPSVGLNYTEIRNEKIDEKGEYGISIDSRKLRFLQGEGGITLGRIFNLNNSWKVKGEVSYTYLHDFRRGYKNLKGNIRDFSLDKYRLSKYSSRLNKNTYGVKLALIKNNTSLYVKYLRGENSENQYILGLSYKF